VPPGINITAAGTAPSHSLCLTWSPSTWADSSRRPPRPAIDLAASQLLRRPRGFPQAFAAASSLSPKLGGKAVCHTVRLCRHRIGDTTTRRDAPTGEIRSRFKSQRAQARSCAGAMTGDGPPAARGPCLAETSRGSGSRRQKSSRRGPTGPGPLGQDGPRVGQPSANAALPPRQVSARPAPHKAAEAGAGPTRSGFKIGAQTS